MLKCFTEIGEAAVALTIMRHNSPEPYFCGWFGLNAHPMVSIVHGPFATTHGCPLNGSNVVVVEIVVVGGNGAVVVKIGVVVGGGVVVVEIVVVVGNSVVVVVEIDVVVGGIVVVVETAVVVIVVAMIVVLEALPMHSFHPDASTEPSLFHLIVSLGVTPPGPSTPM